ncbi:unnamed protein product [Blepharisma stoltei]|uniref:C2H2-type domain-containing protein n=1 Tax=Blepharisma stoltei TaxID=1481888 RepID=A0AAU9JJV2_9CILI|nr:unnamed protein product [Blepharisma stoltei]
MFSINLKFPSLINYMSKPKDSLTAHLEKSTISNIIQTARASLKDPSRPYTPAESVRTLFTNDGTSRPNSSYSLKAMAADIAPKRTARQNNYEPLPQPTRRNISSGGSKKSTREPVKTIQEDTFNVDETNMKHLLDERPDLKEIYEENKEEKSDLLSEIKEITSILEKMHQHPEVRTLYENDDIEALTVRITESLNSLRFATKKPKWAQPQVILKLLGLALERFENEIRKLLKLERCLLQNLVDHDLLYKKKESGLVGTSIATAAVKLLYQYSKNNQNDAIFVEEGLLNTLHAAVTKVVSNEDSVPHDIMLFVLGIVKNLTSNAKIQELAGKINFIAPLASMLPCLYLDDDIPDNPKQVHLLIQITGILRNLALEKTSYQNILLFHVIEKIAKIMQIHINSQELISNSLRALSKLSVQQKVCSILQENDENLVTIVKAIEKYRENLPIIIRGCFVLANIVTNFEKARKVIAYSINLILEIAIQKNLGDMRPDCIDSLVKGVRLIANIITDKDAGKDLTQADNIGKCLFTILNSYNYTDHEELILNTIACATNLLFYDQPQSPFISEDTRTLILSKVAPLMVQTLNAEITLEAVRALGNLTRHESVCKELNNLQIIDILMLLMDHSDDNVVYYTLGSLINISSVAKQLLYSEAFFEKAGMQLEAMALSEPEFSTQICMILNNLCVVSRGMVPWESVAGEDNVKRIAGIIRELKMACDQLIANGEELQDLQSMLEPLQEMMPKPFIPCSYPGCGRKFPNQELLQDHWRRRHEDE